MAAVLLPQDIIEIILSKLPVKSLLRFKAASKSWKTMISDSVFIRKHYHYSSSSQKNHLFLWKSQRWSPGVSLVKFEGGKFQTLRELQESPYCWHTIACFCDGVLLLNHSLSSVYVLWNPSTQAKTTIYCPYRLTWLHSSYGVCYDPTSDDFKVVVSSVRMRDYAVFSCKNKTWTKKKKGFTGRGRVVNESSGLCVNGFIYWVYKEEDVREIVYFDPKDEKLKILEKPKSVKDNIPIFLVCLKGCLCLYCNGDDETVVQIWIRENDCWEELTTIENVEVPIAFFVLEFLAEDKLVIRLNTTRLIVYNISEKTFEEYDDKTVFGYDLVPYVDTLFFPIENTRPKRKRKFL